MRLVIIGLLFFTTFLFSKEVTVSILPQKYFVESIAKDKIKVNVMVQPGASPATYEPKTSQMRSLSNSIAYFSIGVPFEKVWLEKFENANKDMLIVDTTKGIKKLTMKAHHHEGEAHHEDEHEEHANHDEDHEEHEAHHDHEHEEHTHHEDEHEEHADHDEEHEEHGHHHHDGMLDPHVWLDPVLVKVQAKNIYEALVSLDKENKDFYKKNLDEFLVRVDALDKDIKSILHDYHEKAFMVFHPSWGYFSKRYDLEQIAIEVQGKEPKPAQLVELVEEAKEHNIKIVFVAPQFSQNGAKTISNSIKGNVATIDPLAINWEENLLKVANEIAKSYK